VWFLFDCHFLFSGLNIGGQGYGNIASKLQMRNTNRRQRCRFNLYRAKISTAMADANVTKAA